MRSLGRADGPRNEARGQARAGTPGNRGCAEKRTRLWSPSDTFFAFNGDVLTDVDLSARSGLPSQSRGRGLTRRSRRSTTLGLWSGPNRTRRPSARLHREASAGQAPTNLINAGVYVLESALLDRIPAGPGLLGRARAVPGDRAGSAHVRTGAPMPTGWISVPREKIPAGESRRARRPLSLRGGARACSRARLARRAPRSTRPPGYPRLLGKRMPGWRPSDGRAGSFTPRSDRRSQVRRGRMRPSAKERGLRPGARLEGAATESSGTLGQTARNREGEQCEYWSLEPRDSSGRTWDALLAEGDEVVGVDNLSSGSAVEPVADARSDPAPASSASTEWTSPRVPIGRSDRAAQTGGHLSSGRAGGRS